MNRIGWHHTIVIVCFFVPGCPSAMPAGGDGPDVVLGDDGPIAANISGKLGDPLPTATTEQLATFARGKAVFQRQFDRADGLGPAFNVTYCGSCHERPTAGGSAGLYRNYFLGGRLTQDGAFFPAMSAGDAGGVLRVYSYRVTDPLRPAVPSTTTIFAQRNAIPLFGSGLLAEIADEEILTRADPGDADGDGISGRANFDGGSVGRFGRKSQTTSIEGFVRGPLNNQMGITTEPLTDEQRSRLPVESPAQDTMKAAARIAMPGKSDPHLQIISPGAPTGDGDAVPEPEMTGEDLFDLVSFTMLLAAPALDAPTVQSDRGRLLFHEAGCSACHTPRLNGPRGPLPVYSDFLLHDMGPTLADGIVMGEATGSEFRTQPLWGIAAVGPYLHDGRAGTLRDAILAHGGEAQASRDAFAAFSDEQSDDVVEFLLSLGGRDQYSTGLLEPNAPVPATGESGGPRSELSEDDLARFVRGREVFDRDFSQGDGVGGLSGSDDIGRFNGDSCRACHVDPVIGGAGPRGVNVMRHGRVDFNRTFTAPTTTPDTVLHKGILIGGALPTAEAGINVFEHRQTPTLLGVGLVDSISDNAILENEDITDADGDGVSGRAHVLNDGRIGRFGWKARVPNVAEYVRHEMAIEIGMTLPAQPGLSFGIMSDGDGVADPELSLQDLDDLVFFCTTLAPPPRQPAENPALVAQGEALFESIGCAKCHIPSLPGATGDVPLYSDLLLHDILVPGSAGIVDGDASMTEFRTAPLWGLRQTEPYLHSGESDTVDDAIRRHNGESIAVRNAYIFLLDEDREALLAFLDTL